MDNRNAIIERVKKLISLADTNKNSSDKERFAALDKISEILTKYKIDMKEVESNIENDGVTKMTEKFSSVKWARIVIFAIGDMNYCKMFYNVKNTNNMDVTFIGKEEDIIASITLIKYILKNVSREARNVAKLYPHDRSFVRTFENAAAMRISARCHEKITNNISYEKNMAEGSSLVIVETVYDVAKKKNEAYLNTLDIKLEKAKKSTVVYRSGAGFAAGNAYGNIVKL